MSILGFCRAAKLLPARHCQAEKKDILDISRITKGILKNCKKIGKMNPLTVKNGIFKNVKSLQFPMLQGSLNPNIIFLHEKL